MNSDNEKYDVAIMMCCFNGEKYLEQAIKSVINQSYQRWNLYFWDNESTDNSKEIFKKFKDKRLKYFKAPKHTNLGGSRAGLWNKIEGDLVAILDTDDLWEKNKLKIQVSHFDNDECGISISNTIFFDNKKSKVAFKKKPKTGFVYYDLIKNYFISLETVIIRKNFADKLNIVFNAQYNYICDMDLLIRLSKICKLEYSDKILSKWRYHESSLTYRDSSQFIKEKYELIKDLDFYNQGELNNQYINARRKFYEGILLSEGIRMILYDNNKSILRYLRKKKFLSFKLIILILISLIPFNKKIILFLKNRYAMSL